MDLLEKTLKNNYDWAIHRMNVLCSLATIEDIEDAESIRQEFKEWLNPNTCLLYTSPSPRDRQKSRMPSSA